VRSSSLVANKSQPIKRLAVQQFVTEILMQYNIYDTYDQALDDADEQWPPYTGEEFLATCGDANEHRYSLAFGLFLGLGLAPDTANTLAWGMNRLDLISDDLDNPLRVAAFRVYENLCELNYWGDTE
jgi:hypothetical protein